MAAKDLVCVGYDISSGSPPYSSDVQHLDGKGIALDDLAVYMGGAVNPILGNVQSDQRVLGEVWCYQKWCL